MRLGTHDVNGNVQVRLGMQVVTGNVQVRLGMQVVNENVQVGLRMHIVFITFLNQQKNETLNVKSTLH